MENKIIYIYKIKNIINNKVYIGQSINPNNRFKCHMRKEYNGGSSLSINEDVNKYGETSFNLIIIDKCYSQEEANNKEDYWINFYKNNGCSMYNKFRGGIKPPTNKGENHPMCLYTDEQMLEVIKLLQTTYYSSTEIALKTNTSISFVSKVNKGVVRKIEGINYPIRTENFYDIVADKIIYDLQNTTLSQYKIADKYGVARSMVTMINIGKNRHMSNIEYPIRKGRVDKSEN